MCFVCGFVSSSCCVGCCTLWFVLFELVTLLSGAVVVCWRAGLCAVCCVQTCPVLSIAYCSLEGVTFEKGLTVRTLSCL
jgi:hypothetical protein